jgi:hypothetical protein
MSQGASGLTHLLRRGSSVYNHSFRCVLHMQKGESQQKLAREIMARVASSMEQLQEENLRDRL